MLWGAGIQGVAGNCRCEEEFCKSCLYSGHRLQGML